MEFVNFPFRWLLMASLTLGAMVGAVQTGIAQDETYYYRRGKKVPLKVDHTKSFVLFKPQTTASAVEEAIKPSKAILQKFGTAKAPASLTLTQEPSTEAKWAIIENTDIAAAPLSQDAIASDVLYKAPFFRTENNKQVGISQLVLVKLKTPDDKDQLLAQAKELKVDVLGNNKQLPLWYTLTCTKESAGNALQIANKLAETNKFAAAEPDFLVNFQLRRAVSPCVNDTLFDQEWGLSNSGQNGGTVGVDIHACDAWAVATGKGIKVAVVDQGVQLDHPDLSANISPMSFDTVTGGTSQVLGNHATACAGIIGAVRNNQLGVAGVAPEATLISVSDSLMLSPNASQNLATGIAWATHNGADVISNSWGADALANTVLDDAIDEALNNGRGGKGCVVVFAAGNENGPLIYPAKSNPAILAVGAMSPCGQRKSPTSCDSETWWGSCFGPELDVVAPGVLIPTTDRTGPSGYDSGDYYLKFNGTSAATPHVAGVAALVLQVNPSLTREQVVTLIEKCARKVGPYNYQATPGRPNGTFHQEMGYGLVDAKACVDAAKSLTGVDRSTVANPSKQ